MTDKFLLQSQMNEVLGAVHAAGFDRSEFRWVADSTRFDDFGAGISVLQHQSSGFFYAFDIKSRTSHFSRFAPGKQSMEEERFPGEWRLQLGYVKDWLTYLRREVDAPDLWSQVFDTPIAWA